jgi:hypothetical protein
MSFYDCENFSVTIRSDWKQILLVVSSVESDSLLRDYVYIYFFFKWKTGVCSEGRRDIKRWPSQSRNNLICFHLYRPMCFIVCFLTLGVNWGDRAADWVKGLVERYENMTQNMRDDAERTNCIMFTDTMVPICCWMLLSVLSHWMNIICRGVRMR